MTETIQPSFGLVAQPLVYSALEQWPAASPELDTERLCAAIRAAAEADGYQVEVECSPGEPRWGRRTWMVKVTFSGQAWLYDVAWEDWSWNPDWSWRKERPLVSHYAVRPLDEPAAA